MELEIFEVIDPGLGATLQDQGRVGWRRFGVPPGGPMDAHAAAWANRLLENSPEAPVLELALQGAKLAVLQDALLSVTGADAHASVPLWKVATVKAGEIVRFPRNQSGVWIYLAVAGGFSAEKILGSASVYRRGRLGRPVAQGDVLRRAPADWFQFLPSVAGRGVAWSERRNYGAPSSFRVWPGPQWASFSETDRKIFFALEWSVTGQSDRVGYRLAGVPLKPNPPQIVSEPVRVGSIQVPANGQPIVTMRDGPTVGGYPKLGMLDPADLSWLAQCRPGQKVRFELAPESEIPDDSTRP